MAQLEKTAQKITPFLWFDTQAEDAAQYYTGIFPNSRIGRTSRYGEAGKEIHKREPGSVMTIEFELDGQKFTALNGGPQFNFNASVSFVVHCATQKEVDHFWDTLSAGGDPKAQACGWLKDKFGLSWQIVPEQLIKLLTDPDKGRSQRVMAAMMQMKKIDIPALEKAAG